MIEIRIRRYSELSDNWQYAIYVRGKPVAFSRNYYSRRRDAVRGAKRLVAEMRMGAVWIYEGEEK
jgi:hypothetical protein